MHKKVGNVSGFDAKYSSFATLQLANADHYRDRKLVRKFLRDWFIALRRQEEKVCMFGRAARILL